MKKISKKIAALLVVPAAAIGSGLVGGTVGAQAATKINDAVNRVGGSADTASINVGEMALAVVNGLLFFVGVIAVVMLIWGGIKYATSAGDSNKVTAAKNTILYAVVGLAIAVLAFAIVSLITTALTSGTSPIP